MSLDIHALEILGATAAVVSKLIPRCCLFLEPLLASSKRQTLVPTFPDVSVVVPASRLSVPSGPYCEVNFVPSIKRLSSGHVGTSNSTLAVRLRVSHC